MAQSLHAQDIQGSAAAGMVCHSGGTTREIRIHGTPGTRNCRVDYVKSGQPRTLWTSDTGQDFCMRKAESLAQSLVRGGFQCSPLGAASAPRPGVLDERQIKLANEWLRRRTEKIAGRATAPADRDVRRYSQGPDFLMAADVDADGRADLVIGWGWASFRCDGSFLSVLLDPGEGVNPPYRSAEVELPGGCGATGWLASVSDVRDRRIIIDLKQRYPGVQNLQKISASLDRNGRFEFFDASGRRAPLSAIVQSLPTRTQ